LTVDELKDALRTVVAVTATPFDAAGALDEKALTRVVRRVVDGGITAITPNGNTGEFYSLTPAEADRALEVALAAAGGALVVPGVGHAAEVAAGMARRAAELGAPAVMVHQPVHPYQSSAGWVDYHRRIADAVPGTGIVAYLRNPAITGAALAALAAACPNFVAVKYAVPDPTALADAVAAVDDNRLTWVCGLAEPWAPFFWTAGARGFTSGLANVLPRLSLDLLAALRAGDDAAAMALWRSIRPFEDLRARDGNANNVSAVKEALAQLDVAGRTVRPPVSDLADADRALVTRLLTSWHATA
jgi:4-hydroxy-tetrahydrodipicolinate synthase